jgi:hypothetical protein
MKVTLPDGRHYYISKKLATDLDINLGLIKNKNQDLLILIDGPEGAGKSTFARQIGAYCTLQLGVPFDYDGVGNIHNDVEKYINSSLDSPRYSIHIMDEGRKVLNKARSQSGDAVRFTDYLSECREDRNQVHIVLVPAFHDLHPYVVKWRMKLLLNSRPSLVRTGEGATDWDLDIGPFVMYGNDDRLKAAYENKYQYPFARPTDRFPNFEVLSAKGVAAYKAQKAEKLREKYHSASEKERAENEAFIEKIEVVKKLQDKGFTLTEVAGVYGVSRQTLYNWLQKYDALVEGPVDLLAETSSVSV